MDNRITLIGKAGCHLCDAARQTVARVAEELGVGWVEYDINDDPRLKEDYWDTIPVTLVDGRPHDFWKVDEARLREALGVPKAGGQRPDGAREAGSGL